MAAAVIATAIFVYITYRSQFYIINYHFNISSPVSITDDLEDLGFEKARLADYSTGGDGNLPDSYVSVTCREDEVYKHPGKLIGSLGDSNRTIVAWSYRPDGGGKRLYSGVWFKNLFTTGEREIDLYAVWSTNGSTNLQNLDRVEKDVVTTGGVLTDEETAVLSGSEFATYSIAYHLDPDDESFFTYTDSDKERVLSDKSGGGKYTVLTENGLEKGSVYRFSSRVYRKGYQLAAWTDAAGNEYIPGNRYCDLAEKGGTVDLFAKWSRATYQITYMLEDGEKAANPTEYSSPVTEEQQTITLLPAEKDDCYFTGWYLNESLTRRVGETVGCEGKVIERSIDGSEDNEVTLQTIDLTDVDFLYGDLVLYPGFSHRRFSLTFDLGNEAAWSDNSSAPKARRDTVFMGDTFAIYGDRDVYRNGEEVLLGWSFDKQDIVEGVEMEEDVVPEIDFSAGATINTTDIERLLGRGITQRQDIILYPVWVKASEPAENDTYILDCSAKRIGNSVDETENTIFISVEASTPGKVASLDDRFYLVAINQVTGEVEYVLDAVSQEEAVRDGTEGRISGEAAEQGIIRFELPLGTDDAAGEPYHRYKVDIKDGDTDIDGPSDGQNISAVMLDYAIAVREAKRDGQEDGQDAWEIKAALDNDGGQLSDYVVISNTAYVSRPEVIAHGHYFNEGRSKKGIQGAENVIDFDNGEYVNADYADVSHVFINLYASNIIVKAPVDCDQYNDDPMAALVDGYNYEYNDKFYSFQGSPSGMAAILNEKNVSLTVQVSLDYSEMTMKMINTKARAKGHELYSWENSSTESREWIEAMFCWLAENLSGVSQENGYASNWILGNEVNSYNTYQYSGSMSRGEFFRSYTETFRSYYNAIKSYNSDAKVYICADQCWNSSENGYSAKDLLDTCNNLFSQIENGTMDWNIAYHPYSYPLISKTLWENTNIEDSVNTTYITMYNLDVLTDYIKQNYYHVGSDGNLQIPKVIISELGWTYKDNAKNQAASLVYGYYISACNDLVVAYEPRSMYDAPQETKNGLYFGLMNSPTSPRGSLAAYRDCDRNMDSTYYEMVDATATGWTHLKGILGHIPDGQSLEDHVLRNDSYDAP